MSKFVINNKIYSTDKQLGTVAFKDRKVLIADDLSLIDLSKGCIYNSVYHFIKECDNITYNILITQMNEMENMKTKNYMIDAAHIDKIK